MNKRLCNGCGKSMIVRLKDVNDLSSGYLLCERCHYLCDIGTKNQGCFTCKNSDCKGTHKEPDDHMPFGCYQWEGEEVK